METMSQLRFSFMADGSVAQAIGSSTVPMPNMRHIRSVLYPEIYPREYDVDGADRAAEDERDGQKTD